MKRIRLMFLFLLGCAAGAAPAPARQTLSFDRDWKFYFGDVPGAEKPEWNDAPWRVLDVPHDWSIEGVSAGPESEGPFDRKSPGGTGAGALNGGIGWYRKSFTLPAEARGQRVSVEFDGIYMDSETWLNGVSLGRHPYGYTSFHYDLTPHVKLLGEVTAGTSKVSGADNFSTVDGALVSYGVRFHTNRIASDVGFIKPVSFSGGSSDFLLGLPFVSVSYRWN